MESWADQWRLYDMASSDEQWQFLRHVGLLIRWAEEHGYKLTGGDLHRDKDTQQRMVNTGKSKTMYSRHCVRCAVDLNIWKDNAPVWEMDKDACHEAIKPLGEYWESLHEKNSWGVKRGAPDWDENHFERTA